MELPGESKLCDFMELLRFMYVGSCSISSANCTALLQLSNFYAARACAPPQCLVETQSVIIRVACALASCVSVAWQSRGCAEGIMRCSSQ